MKLLTAKEVAEALRCSVDTVRRWQLEGFHGQKLGCTRIGRRVYFQWHQVEAFLKASNQGVEVSLADEQAAAIFKRGQ